MKLIIIKTNNRGGIAKRIAEAFITPQGVSNPRLEKLAATTGSVTFLEDKDNAINNSFQVITNVKIIAPINDGDATGKAILVNIPK